MGLQHCAFGLKFFYAEWRHDTAIYRLPPGNSSFLLVFLCPVQDGSVLLAKYIEHQLKAMTSYARRQEAPTQRRPQHNTNNNTGRPIRVLELGCGTGLAGLAAGFALGRNSGDGEDHLLSSSRPIRPTEGAITPPTKEVEVVLTDLPYVLANTRANISRNAALFEAVGVDVVATELDWCRPLPRGLIGEAAAAVLLKWCFTETRLRVTVRRCVVRCMQLVGVGASNVFFCGYLQKTAVTTHSDEIVCISGFACLFCVPS